MSAKNSTSDGDTSGSSSDLTRDVENVPISEAKQEVESIPDPNIVDWDGPNDPENPQNW